MKRKELKNLAKKIAKYEQIVQNDEDPSAVREAQLAIMEISSTVHSLEDMMLIDEYVQDILAD